MKKRVKEKVEERGFDLNFWILLIALIALPLSSLLLHTKIHSEYWWLTYLVLFDIIVISLLYLFRKTIFYGFMLNTTFFIVGVIAHLTVAGGISDVLLAIPDFAIGYTLWRGYK